MAAHKRTKMQREADLVIMTSMWIRGKTQKEIAEKFGLTQGQISHDLKEVHVRVAALNSEVMAKKRAQRLTELAEIKREAWESWEKSKADKEVQIKEQIASKSGQKNQQGDDSDVQDGAATDSERIKALLRTEGQCGEAIFLAEIRKAIQEENKIDGMYAAEKVELGGGRKPLQFIYVHEPPAAVPETCEQVNPEEPSRVRRKGAADLRFPGESAKRNGATLNNTRIVGRQGTGMRG
jgi:hypothetical protein